MVNALLALIIPGFFGGVVLGSSAAMLGLIVAFALRYPDQGIYLFFVLRVPGRAIIPLTLGLDLLVRLTGSPIAIGAHWGGMLTAYLLLTGTWRPSRLRARLGLAGRKKKLKRPFEVVDGGRGGPWVS